MKAITDRNTIIFETISLIGLFIPGTLLFESWYSDGSWAVSTFASYAAAMYRGLLLVIMILLILLVIVVHILRMKKNSIPLLSQKNIWIISIMPLAWFILSSIYTICMFRVTEMRLVPGITFVLEIIVLAFPIIRHRAWIKISNNMGEKQSDGKSTFIIFVTVFLWVALIIFNIMEFGGSGEDISYYLDYNGNGQMDNGEHVYDEYQDGGGGLDYDGDGWNDTNY